MASCPCPRLGGEVELSEERSQHIIQRHPELLPDPDGLIRRTLEDPDQIRRSTRFSGARLLSRWYDDLRGGKHIVVVVNSDLAAGRHWVLTAYMARRLGPGEVEWQKH